MIVREVRARKSSCALCTMRDGSSRVNQAVRVDRQEGEAGRDGTPHLYIRWSVQVEVLLCREQRKLR